MNDQLPPNDQPPEDPGTEGDISPSPADPDRQYVVVARRYRPQGFDQLIGQEHVAQALSNAISSSRVGHAYIFTGARGVGKTSAARIFAKALNCVDGPTQTPCNKCEICLGIGSGDDIDVLEIDGASNRGIDEIRSLRQNVGVRPTRSRFKVYIIDEVHMLTREAFNALLKTLEEPPEHVKFIFCTTEPNKIPVTILSRCQRFDFAGIASRSIMGRLRQIVDAEGVEAEDDALRLLAQRAAGSMRDSQSLLEQVLAFSSGKITVDQVHSILGTAGGDLLGRLVEGLIARNAPTALEMLDTAISRGVDPGQMLEQLYGYFRDMMAAVCGCTADQFQYAAAIDHDNVAKQAKQLGLSTIMAAMQILDQTLSRMRVSLQSRILAELALVRICNLEELDRISDLIAELRAATIGAPPPERPKQGGDSVTPPVMSDARPADQIEPPPQEYTTPEPTPTPPPETPAAPIEPHPPADAPPVVEETPPIETGPPTPPQSEIEPAVQVEPTPVVETEPPAQEPPTPEPEPVVQMPELQVPEQQPPAQEPEPSAPEPQSSVDSPSPQADETSQPQTAQDPRRLWLAVCEQMTGTAAGFARDFERVDMIDADRMQVRLKQPIARTFCQKPEIHSEIRDLLVAAAGRPMSVEFDVVATPAQRPAPMTETSAATRGRRLGELAEHPFLKQANEIFGAEPADYHDPNEELEED